MHMNLLGAPTLLGACLTAQADGVAALETKIAEVAGAKAPVFVLGPEESLLPEPEARRMSASVAKVLSKQKRRR